MSGTSGVGVAKLVSGAVVAVVLLLVGYFIYQKNLTATGVEPVALASLPKNTQGTPTKVELEIGQNPDKTQTDDTPFPSAAPKFDLVRIEPDGASVMAGVAEPDQDVRIILDGQQVATAKSDAQGNFVAMLDLPISDAAQILSLAVSGSGDTPIISTEQVILAPVASALMPVLQSDERSLASVKPQQAVTVPTLQIGTAAPAADDTLPKTNTANSALPKTALPPVAPAVLLSTDQGVRLLQPARSSAPVIGHVVIDAISYDALGEVQLTGRGSEAGFVRVYLDNTPIQTAVIDPDGAWHTDLPDVDAGVYVLRVDQVDAQGAVVSRTETPFKREAAAILQKAQTQTQARSVSSVTVQPGSTLWAIARDNYGEGILYVKVFQANRDNIRNPDLIYPGQVFEVPQ